jgi:two-component system, cell cycle sensor histidine kinase and response regulator CckA
VTLSPNVSDEQQIRERLYLAIRASQDLIWDWDLVTGEVSWEGNATPFFGPGHLACPPGDAYRLWAERVHPEDRAVTEAAARAAIKGGAELWEHEYRWRRMDGTWAHMLERACIARGPDGRVRRIVGSMRDISPRKQSEEAAERLAAIVASSSDGIIGKTLDGIITSWNAAAERIFGYTAEEIVGRPIFPMIPEELHDTERSLLERIRRGERTEFADTVRIRKDGRRIFIALTVSPIWDSSGVVIGASSIARDITDRKRADEELARREERYRALVTATTSIVWTAGPDGAYTEPQPSWQRYTGQSEEEYRGAGWLDAVHPDDRPGLQDAWRRARASLTIYDFQCRIYSRAHQAHRHVISRAAPVLGIDGQVREWIGTVTDIEERWVNEARLRQAERMESVGRLAGGIAHEANNQMTVILGAAAFIQRRILDPTVREDIEHVRRAAQRTAAITQQLLAFSRRQVLRPEVVGFNAVVRNLEPIIRRALGETSRLELVLAPDLGNVKADPGQLEQVLLNLTLNARDAMPAGGVLRIETANVELDQPYVAAKGIETLMPGRYAQLVVSDTGLGMDRKTLARIFEPFFTTKDVGQGSGLGLATVYGVVKQSNGFVWAYSEPGLGTAFKIYLPLVDAAQAVAPLAPVAPIELRSGSVLVVEDDADVRSIIGRTLRERGYTVTEAADGVEALALARRQAVPPDLVVADVVMPRMGGRELAARLEEQWPGIPVLFTSGYTGADAVGRGLLEDGSPFLQKPLDPDTLARAIDRMAKDRPSR